MRDVLTTLLELAGGLLLAAAAGIAVGAVTTAAGVAVGGAVLIGESWLLERIHAKPSPAPAARGDDAGETAY